MPFAGLLWAKPVERNVLMINGDLMMINGDLMMINGDSW